MDIDCGILNSQQNSGAALVPSLRWFCFLLHRSFILVHNQCNFMYNASYSSDTFVRNNILVFLAMRTCLARCSARRCFRCALDSPAFLSFFSYRFIPLVLEAGCVTRARFFRPAPRPFLSAFRMVLTGCIDPCRCRPRPPSFSCQPILCNILKPLLDGSNTKLVLSFCIFSD